MAHKLTLAEDREWKQVIDLAVNKLGGLLFDAHKKKGRIATLCLMVGERSYLAALVICSAAPDSDIGLDVSLYSETFTDQKAAFLWAIEAKKFAEKERIRFVDPVLLFQTKAND